jgi:predicted ABC-type ATPase
MEMRPPVLLITCGPTGSGKSGLARETMKIEGVDRYTSVLVDDIVEPNEKYKRGVLAALRTQGVDVERLLEDGDDGEALQKQFDKPSRAFLADLQTAYMNARLHGCSGSCDSRNNTNLANALEARENVVLETTGRSYPTWLMDMMATKRNRVYRVIMAFTFVDYTQLVQRNRQRAVKMAQAMHADLRSSRTVDGYVSNKNLNGPRLPDINSDVFLPMIRMIIKMLISVLDLDCIRLDEKKCSATMCGKTPLSALYIFDNSGSKLELVMDLTRGERSVRLGDVAKLLALLDAATDPETLQP